MKQMKMHTSTENRQKLILPEKIKTYMAQLKRTSLERKGNFNSFTAKIVGRHLSCFKNSIKNHELPRK